MGDELYENWATDDRVEIINVLDDIDYDNSHPVLLSCIQWGNLGGVGIPPIVDDGTGFTIFGWFNNPGGLYPMIVFIDHNKTVFNILYVHPFTFLDIANLMIETMLEAMPNMSIPDNSNTSMDLGLSSRKYSNQTFLPVSNFRTENY